jgi:regulator of cell morphogenesis and NO signaling
MPENNEYYPQVMQRYTSQPHATGAQTEFIGTLLRAFEDRLFSAADFGCFSVELIVDYILRTHVYYLEKKLPEIEQSILLLSGHYDSHHPILTALRNFFHRYVTDLSEHIRAEETLLLPYIALLSEAAATPAGLSRFLLMRDDYSINRFLDEHHDTEDELRDIRQTIRLYDPPSTNESLYRILLAQLHTFEQDLCVHANIEEQVLIPKACELEGQLNRRLRIISSDN